MKEHKTGFKTKADIVNERNALEGKLSALCEWLTLPHPNMTCSMPYHSYGGKDWADKLMTETDVRGAISRRLESFRKP